METIAVVQGTFQAGAKLLNAVKLSQEISALRASVYETYLDHSKAHFNSALEAIRMAETSKSPETELRHGVHHLYDAYFALHGLLEKTVQEGVFWKTSRPYVKYQEDIYVPCCKIAGLTSRLYSFLGEGRNAEEWNRRGREMQEKARSIYMEILQYHEALPYQPRDAVKFQGLGDVVMMRRRTMEISMRANFSEETRKREISEAHYERLRRIDSGYAALREFSLPKPAGKRIDVESYRFYFMTINGLQYIKKTIQSLEDAVKPL